MNKELQNRFLILFAISALEGSVSKKDTLDYLENNQLIKLSDNDLAILETRNEPKWRNELAFVRQHLVEEGFLSNEVKSKWTITNAGEDYLAKLITQISEQESYQRFNPKNLITDKHKTDLSYLSKIDSIDLIIDLEIENESTEIKVKLIKRHKKIVDQLKKKYDSQCQIESCGFTFIKANGSNYSEAHHLVPLTKNGSQKEENVIILCPNHHRMFHYCSVKIHERDSNLRQVAFNGVLDNIVYK